MARGAEIYRKIEEAYCTCNWAEVGRLAKKYRRRSDLSEEWEAVLEGMAGMWRAVERSEAAAGIGRSIRDSPDRLDSVRVAQDVLKEIWSVVHGKVKEETTGLLPAVKAVLLCIVGEHQQAVSLFNTTTIASIICSPILHLLFANPRTNTSSDMPMVASLVALHCILFKGQALEGIQQNAQAVEQYSLIVDFVFKSQADFLAIKKVMLEALYRRAMLLSRLNKAACATALKEALLLERKERMELGAVRKILLCERWLEVLPAVHRRHSLRNAVDSAANDATDLVAESLEEERVWTCEVMIACLRVLYEQHRRLFNDNRDLVERLNGAVVKNLALGSAFYLLVDFLKTGVYARMPVGRAYYTQIFLALMASPGYTLSEAYIAGDILVTKYPVEVDSSIKTAFISCCYRLGMYDRAIGLCRAAAGPLSRVLHAKALIQKYRADAAEGLLAEAEDIVRRDASAEVFHVRAAIAYERHNIDSALELITRACQLDAGELKYHLYHALLLSAKKDYPQCLACLCRLWADYPVRSIDLTLAKARCEQALGRSLAAIETLASRLSYNISQAAKVAASTTLFSSSDPHEASSVLYMAATTASSVSDGDLSRAAGFLSEPAVDILHHKIQTFESAAGPLGAAEEYEQAFPKDPIEFRAERLEHGLHIPGLLSNSARLTAVEREEYSELQLLLELTNVYIGCRQQEEVDHCMACIRKLDNLLPHLYYLQGLPTRALSQFERSLEYGGCTEGLLAIARIHMESGNAAYSKMLLTKMPQNDYRRCLLLGQSCLLMGQIEDAGIHLNKAMMLEEHCMLYTPHL